MGQLRNKCVLDVPASANWSTWVNNDKHWFIVEGNPELCGNASGARCITVIKHLPHPPPHTTY
jgi:hypothetical protein